METIITTSGVGQQPIRNLPYTTILRRLLPTAILVLLWFAPAQAQSGEVADLLRRVNNLRTSLGLDSYRFDETLRSAAQRQAQWMVDNGNITHTWPNGTTLRTRTQAAGYVSLDVSENIFGGSNATTVAAWNFWLNSAIHYAGLTNSRYQEIGIGVAHGPWGATYVLVFGNPGGPGPAPPNRSGSAAARAAPAQPPSYVIGTDERGNIMHRVQPGDTLGDIALIYGYVWEDIPYMMQINGLEDNRALEIGSVFLVPPQDGTFTPTPGDPATPIPAATALPTEAPAATLNPSPIPTAAPSPTTIVIATAASVPQGLIATAITQPPPTATIVNAVAAAPTGMAAVQTTTTIDPDNGAPIVLIAAVVIQAGLLLAAGYEFLSRKRP